MDHLRATEISASAIVFGKVSARLIQAGGLLLSGMPILCLASLLGGVELPTMLYTLAITGGSLVTVACLSILVSAYSPRSRDAVIATYLLIFSWFALPWLLDPFSSRWSPTIDSIRASDPERHCHDRTHQSRRHA